MAVKKKERSEPQYKQIAESVNKMVAELLKEHGKEIVALYEEAEDGKATVNFGVEIDCSESEPMVTTRIRFSTSVTDKRVTRLDDPKQIKLFTELPRRKKGDEEVEEEGEKSKTKTAKVAAEGESETAAPAVE